MVLCYTSPLLKTAAELLSKSNSKSESNGGCHFWHSMVGLSMALFC